MVAATCDFHIFASRVTTRLPAIRFSVWYIAEAWDVRALSRLLIRHYNSVLSGHLSDRYNPATLEVAPFTEPTPEVGGETHSLQVVSFRRLRHLD